MSDFSKKSKPFRQIMVLPRRLPRIPRFLVVVKISRLATNQETCEAHQVDSTAASLDCNLP